MKTELAKDYQDKRFETYFQNERPEMLCYVPQSVSRLLDIGCSDGSFSWQLKLERNVEVWGIEPNEQAATIAASRLDKVIFDVFNSQLDLPKNSFDCIILNDVLEHLVDPFAALDSCKSLLSKKGVIIASIPNVRYFDNIWKLLVYKSWEYVEEGILDKTHLRFFTQKSILETFEKTGYIVDLIEGINPLSELHPLYKKFRFLNLLLMNSIEDMRYMQFAVVASIK